MHYLVTLDTLQAADCTMHSRPNALALRPSTRRLLHQLQDSRNVLPEGLANMLPGCA